jgi:hypothetical protein
MLRKEVIISSLTSRAADKIEQHRNLFMELEGEKHKTQADPLHYLNTYEISAEQLFDELTELHFEIDKYNAFKDDKEAIDGSL